MSEKLQRAIALVRAGDKQHGRRLLAELLRTEPQNETAWLWMSGVVTTDQQRRDCLERVLAINPANRPAQRGMALLQSQKAQRGQAKAPAPPATTYSATAHPAVAPARVLRTRDATQGGADETSAVHSQPSSRQNGPSESSTAASPSPGHSGVVQERPVPLPQTRTKVSPALRIVLISSLVVLVCGLVGIVTYLVLAPMLNLPTRTAKYAGTTTLLTPGAPTATPPGEDITDADYVKGKAAYDAQNYEQVLRLMSRVIERHPDLAPPHWYRGMAYFYSGEYETMLDEMEKALAIDPEYALGYADRGLAYVSLGNEKRAMADWQKALSLDPSLAKVHHNIAIVYANQGDWARAMPGYDRALAIDPNRAHTWSDRGQALLNLEQFQDCIDSTTRALDLKPDIWIAYYHRGTCKTELGQYSSAIPDFDQYVDAVPDDPRGWYNRGLTRRLGGLGDDQQAVDDYTRAIQLDPTFTWALINRGNVYIDLEEYRLALADYNAALALGEIPRAYMGRGDAYWGLAQYDEAVDAYKKAIKMIPGYASAYARLARTYVDQGAYQEAIEAADRALALDPGGSDELAILQTRGRAYYGLNDYRSAIEDLNRVIETRPSVMDFYYRGIVYQANDQKKLAAQDLETFLAYGGAGDRDKIDDAKARLSQLQ